MTASNENDPSAESLEEMPEIDDVRYRQRPGRGHHVGLNADSIIAIDPDVWPHFGSAEAVNEALRQLIAAKTTNGT
jgi:hypothetical protein